MIATVVHVPCIDPEALQMNCMALNGFCCSKTCSITLNVVFHETENIRHDRDGRARDANPEGLARHRGPRRGRPAPQGSISLAHIRQSRPDSGLVFQAKVLKSLTRIQKVWRGIAARGEAAQRRRVLPI